MFFRLFSVKSTSLCPRCSPDETQTEHNGKLHFSQCSSHSFVECFEHFWVDLLFLNGTIYDFWIGLRDVHPHRLYTDVYDKFHSTSRGLGSHRDGTEKHTGSKYAKGPWSNTHCINWWRLWKIKSHEINFHLRLDSY